MAENVGAIYYTVEAETSKLISGLDSANKSIDSLGSGFNKADKAARQAEMRLTKTAAAVRGLGKDSNAVANSVQSLNKILLSLVSLRTAVAVIDMADGYREMAERVKQASKDTTEYEKVQKRLLETANGTYRELREAQEVYISTADTLRSMGYETDQVLDITDSMSYSFVANATSADKAQSAINAFTGAMNKGTVDANAWQTVISATPTIINDLAEVSGRSAAEVRKLGAEGKISAAAMAEAWLRSRDANKKASDDMATTGKDALMQLKNALTMVIGETNMALGVTDDLGKAILRMAEAVKEVDVQALVREIIAMQEALSAVWNTANELFEMISTDSQEAAGYIQTSFEGSIMATAKEIDGLAEIFKKMVGYLKVDWRDLTENIPILFENAYNKTLAGAADFVNSMSEMLNKPLQALGMDGFSKVSWGSKETKSGFDVEAARREVDNNAKGGLGAHAAMQARINKRLADAMRDAADAADAEAEALNKNGKAKRTAAGDTVNLTDKNDKSTRSRKASKDAIDADTRLMISMANAIGLAALKGEDLAVAKARLALTPSATKAEVETVEALARALHKVEQSQRLREKVGDDPQAYIRGNDAPLSGGAFDDQVARYDAEAIKEQERHEASLVRLREAMEAQKLTLTEYYAQFEGLTETHNARMGQIDTARQSTMLSTYGSAFGSIASLIRNSQGEQSGAYKAMFAVTKAFAIADAGLKLNMAIMQAMADPTALTPMQKLANYAAIASAGAGLLSSLSSASFGGRQYGGPTDPGKMYRINENGAPEVFNAANGQQFMLPNTRGYVVSNKDAAGGKGGGEVNLTVQLIEDKSRAGQVEQSRMDDAYIVRVVVADIMGEGDITKAGMGYLNWRRQGR